MSIGSSLERRQEFIARFQELAGWANPNVEEHTPLHTLFDTVDDDSFPGAILPRLIDGDTVYYVLAESGRDWRSLSPLLKAFVGVTVTDFIGLTSNMSDADPLEAWLSSFGFKAIARFGTEDTLRQRIAEAGLLRLRDCLHLSEVRRRTHPRSTPQVMDDFRMALAAGDSQAAQRNITFLRTNMRLDALNLCFLEVQLDATFGDWEQLHRRSFFGELCYTRRPPNVTTAMVKAIYHTRVEPVELADGLAAVLAFFRSEIHGQYGELFKVCPPTPQPSVAKMFLLTAIAGEDIDRPAVDRLTVLKAAWSEDEVRSFDQFLALVEAPDPTTAEIVKSSWASLLQGLELAEDETEPATIDRAKAVLWSAVELQTLDAYRTAIDYVNRLSAVEREALLATPGYAGIWANISQHTTDERIPRNWCEWFELLPRMSYAQAQSYAERSVTEWPIARHLQYPGDVEELVDALGDMALTEEERISTVLPNLLLWVQSDEHWPNSAYLPLYEQLLTLFMLTDNRNPNTLQAFATLLEGMLLLGMVEVDYTQLMDELGKLTQHLGGTRY